ncbi:virulence protein [Streptococcus acidominimus]|uniref:Virulence protein n=1 Tax=Streptococcus acidominimus TaxID=1326 RepID=A0A4Y9FNJ7_STRAI|nr:virulence protein [Streptococcus acidominimus]MBF0819298.1 virulence protein [Streptococcus acidominimus]MBF0839638.1 virulence protein [Streptococcus acidominimus]MBF0848980.1 virulence protein [Streptococcus danieliae]TFU30083.1 virulence protein [Streptococcus acidominimus]
MGLRYSSTDSKNLMQAMNNNIAIAKQIMDRLSNGCDHLISTVDSGELTGAAYTAGRELFAEIIVPSIKKLQTAVDDIQAELTSYQYADSVVSEYGTLDLDQLKEQLNNRYQSLALVEEQLESNSQLLTQLQSFLTGNSDHLWEQIFLLKDLKRQLELGIRDLETRIQKLEWFHQDVSRYFSDSLVVLQLAIQGATALQQITVDANGHYNTTGISMAWFSSLKGQDIQTFDRGGYPKLSLINQNIRDLMLSDEAARFYRKELTALLEGKPASEWPLIIQAVNQALTFDHQGNIVSLVPINVGSNDGIIVLKNGTFDEELTKQGNEEKNSQLLEALGEQATQILSGVIQITAGSIGTILSAGLGATGSIALSLPTGGTATIPIASAAAAGISLSATFVASGTAALVDGLSEIALATKDLQLSFTQSYDHWQATKPTSKTFGKPVEGRINGRKAKIRVDAEPDSHSIHIQTGGGKRSPLKVDIPISEITDKNSIYRVLKDLHIPEVRNLGKGQLDELVKKIWNAYQWLKS